MVDVFGQSNFSRMILANRLLGECLSVYLTLCHWPADMFRQRQWDNPVCYNQRNHLMIRDIQVRHWPAWDCHRFWIAIFSRRRTSWCTSPTVATPPMRRQLKIEWEGSLIRRTPRALFLLSMIFNYTAYLCRSVCCKLGCSFQSSDSSLRRTEGTGWCTCVFDLGFLRRTWHCTFPSFPMRPSFHQLTSR